MQTFNRLILLLLLVLGGCGDTESSSVAENADAGVSSSPDAGESDPGPDLTEAMFQADHVLDIRIDMQQSDWDELRVQTRSFFDVLGTSCLMSPPPRPFTYFPATVTIDGEEVTQVGVRKKGFFGSLSDTKPSLKIKFSEYLPEQRFSGMKRLTLNNNKSDPSHIKQCIGYQLFAKAGVPAPRCSFANVTVNGTNLGIFTNVESIKKQFLARHFESNGRDLSAQNQSSGAWHGARR
jgi:spore coat protein CotH